MGSGNPEEASVLIFSGHFIMEVREAESFFWASTFPFAEQTYRQTAKHSQDPDCILISDSAAILMGGDIRALMETIFNSPILTLKVEPVLGMEIISAGDDKNGFWFSSGGLAVKFSDLSRGWKANLFRGHFQGSKRTRFLASTIFFMGLSGILRRGSRGKRPPEWRSSGFGEFLGFLFGYP